MFHGNAGRIFWGKIAGAPAAWFRSSDGLHMAARLALAVYRADKGLGGKAQSREDARYFICLCRAAMDDMCSGMRQDAAS